MEEEGVNGESNDLPTAKIYLLNIKNQYEKHIIYILILYLCSLVYERLILY